MRSTRPVLGLLSLSLIAFAAARCGGSTTESVAPGGTVVDSGTPDAQQDAAPEAADQDALVEASEDASPDVSPDVSEDVAPDVADNEASLFDLTMPDVALNDSGATVQTCYDCASTTCSSGMAQCEADDKCRTLVLCLFVDQCFGGTGPGGIDTGCAFGCLGQAGISDYNDPAISVAMTVGQCVNDSCSAQCALPDGGVMPPLDAGGPG